MPPTASRAQIKLPTTLTSNHALEALGRHLVEADRRADDAGNC